MSHPAAPFSEMEEVLAAQLAALARYRQIVEAQRAVLRMSDAGLLQSFSREAAGIVADVSALEVRLMSIRQAAQLPDPPAHPSRLASLYAQVERERVQAAQAATRLAQQMEAEGSAVAAEIRGASRQLGALLRGYGAGIGAEMPGTLDRRG